MAAGRSPSCWKRSRRGESHLQQGLSHFLSLLSLMLSAGCLCSSLVHREAHLWRSSRPSRLFLSSASSSPVITSLSNTQVKLLRSLQSRKARDEENLVLLEGFRQVIDALQAGLTPRTILWTEEATRSPLGNSLVTTLQEKQPKASLQMITDAVYKTLSDTVHGQGVVAAFNKPQPPNLTQLFARSKVTSRDLTSSSLTAITSDSPLVLVLDRLADPGNVGTLVRSGFGLGAQAIVSVEGCDIWSPKVLRSAMGLVLRIPVIETSWEETSALLQELSNLVYLQSSKSIAGLALIKQRKWTVLRLLIGENKHPHNKLQVVIADGNSDNRDYHTVDYTHPTIIIVGSEADGVRPEVKQLKGQHISTIPVKIPMTRSLESFNAAVAGSIILAECAKQRRVATSE